MGCMCDPAGILPQVMCAYCILRWGAFGVQGVATSTCVCLCPFEFIKWLYHVYETSNYLGFLLSSLALFFCHFVFCFVDFENENVKILFFLFLDWPLLGPSNFVFLH